MMEIIPKPAQKLPFWQKILIYFSLVALLASISSYFVLGQFISGTNSSLKESERKLAKGKTDEEISLENKVLTYQKKINDFGQLAALRQYSSKFFSFFEKRKINYPCERLDIFLFFLWCSYIEFICSEFVHCLLIGINRKRFFQNWNL